jgi:hypothetical protein
MERRPKGLAEFSGRLILNHRPVRVGFRHMAWNVSFPLLLHVRVQIEGQFPVDNLPEHWVPVELCTHCHPARTETAICIVAYLIHCAAANRAVVPDMGTRRADRRGAQPYLLSPFRS